MNHTYKIKVNEEFEYDLNSEDLDALDVVGSGHSAYHVLKENIPYHAEIVLADFNAKKYAVKVNSEIYEVSIADHLDLLIDQMGFDLSFSKDIDTIEAPMPGLILDINVRVGSAVNENDPLVILEAMKMENVITSPRDGIIKNITVKKGEAVDKDHVIIEFE
ncbi:MAG: acetyl-CoA carboxylase biotin carboxyl carrier protein subunit [Flavobacteriaceae bacterium]